MPLVTLIVYGLLGVLLAAVLISFVLPLRLLQGRARTVTLVLVAAAWAILYQQKIGEPEALREWRRTVQSECQSQLPTLPSVVHVNGFMDEGTALRKAMLLELFERGLSFIEIKVARRSQSTPYIAYADGDQEDAWSLPNVPDHPWVHLELSKQGDPACAELPYGLDNRVARPPFLPDTCFAIRHMKEPTARVALRLSPPADASSRTHGRWILVDRESGSILAALPTAEDASPIGTSAGRLSTHEQTPSLSCTTPHTVLVGRLRGTRSGQSHDDQMLQQVLLRANTSADMAAKVSPNEPILKAVALGVGWTESESRFIFNREVYPDDWRKSIQLAREHGTLGFGSKLLNWTDRKLISLSVTADVADAWRWKVIATGKGFFVADTRSNWFDSQANALMYYDRDGAHRWTIRIAPPESRSRCKHYLPQAIYATETHLAIASRCGVKLSYDEWLSTGASETGELWLIRRSDIPEFND